jgi:hypothetical protein
MTATELTALSMSELKSVCVDRAISVSGDKRAKTSYILAIVSFDRHQQELAIMPITDPFDEPMTFGLPSAIELQTPALVAIPHGGRCTNEPNHSSPLEIGLKSNDPNRQLLPPQPPSSHSASIAQ